MFFDHEYKIKDERLEDGARYAFTYLAQTTRTEEYGIKLLEIINREGTDIDFSTVTGAFQTIEEQRNSYAKLMSYETDGVNIDNISFETVVSKSIEHIYGKKPTNVYKAIIATGYSTVVLDKPLTERDMEYAKILLNNPNHLFTTDELRDCADTDGDGLYDFEEVVFWERDYDNLLTGETVYSEVISFINGELKLNTVSELLSIYGLNGSLRFVEKGIPKCEMQYGDCWDDFMDYPVLPIYSDPTSKDGDEDGIWDNLDGEALRSNEYFGILVDYINEGKIQFSDVISDGKVSICTVPITDLDFVIGFEPIKSYDQYGDEYDVGSYKKDIINGYFENWYIVVVNNNGSFEPCIVYTTDCQNFVDNNSNPFKIFSKAFDSYAMSYKTIFNGYVEDGFWKTNWDIFTGFLSSQFESIAGDLDTLSFIGGRINEIFVPKSGHKNTYFDYSEGFGKDSNTATYAYKKFEEKFKLFDEESDTYKAVKTITYTNQMIADTGVMVVGAFIATGGETIAFGGVALAPETGGGSLAVAIPAEAFAVVGAGVSATGTLLLASDIQGYNSASQAMRDAKMFELGDGLSNAIHAGKPGSQSWNEAKKAIRDGKGKGINVIANSEDDARKLLSEARSELQEFETYTPEKYKAGFEAHPAEPDVGNDLPHLKWKDWSNGKSSGANGHIFWEE